MTQTATVEEQVQTAIRAESPEAIQSVVAELQRRKVSAVDYRVPGRGLALTDEDGKNRLTLNLGDLAGTVAYDVSNVAHGQLASITGIHGSYYKRLREEATGLLATNVNHWLGQSRKSHIVRTLDNRVRAIVSDGYRTLDSSDLVFETFDTLTELKAEITRLDLTDERFYLRALAPEWRQRIDHQREALGGAGGHRFGRVGGFDDDYVIPGVVISNSDVGVGALKVERFLFRLACSNGMTTDDVYARIHRGEKQTEDGVLSQETLGLQNTAIWAEVRDILRAAFNPEKFAETVRALGLATGKAIDEPVQAVEIVSKHYGVTDADKQRILNAFVTGGEGATVFGLLQSVTATAREKADYNDGIALERIGGRLLDEADKVLVSVIRR